MAEQGWTASGMELCARLLEPGLPTWLARWNISGVVFYGAFDRLFLGDDAQVYDNQLPITAQGGFPFGLDVLPD